VAKSLHFRTAGTILALFSCLTLEPLLQAQPGFSDPRSTHHNREMLVMIMASDCQHTTTGITLSEVRFSIAIATYLIQL
jgi:hypothetical protein